MSRLFPVVVKRITNVISGAGQVISVVVPGINLTNRISSTLATVIPGVSAQQGPTSVTPAPVVPGVAVSGVDRLTGLLATVVAGVGLTNRLGSTLATVIPGVVVQQGPSSVTPAPLVPGVAMSSVNSGGPNAGTYLARPGIAVTNVIAPAPTLAVPGVEIVQIKYDLTKRAGGNAQAAVGTAWTNPGNATGLNDGANATSVGSALGNTQGIELSYANSVGKAELTILSASLSVYYTVVDALGLCTRTLSYNIGAGLVMLSTGTGAVSVTPSVFTIPITTWTQFDAFQVRLITAYAAVSALSNATLDAAVLTVTATRTDTDTN